MNATTKTDTISVDDDLCEKWLGRDWPDTTTPAEAMRLATACQAKMDAGDSRDYTAILAEVIEAKESYRIVVGEKGNEQGHVEDVDASTLEAAQAALKAALKPYGKDGWGRVEMKMPGGWMRV